MDLETRIFQEELYKNKTECIYCGNNEDLYLVEGDIVCEDCALEHRDEYSIWAEAQDTANIIRKNDAAEFAELEKEYRRDKL